MISKLHPAIGKAILAAALFGMSAPFSKILLEKIPPTIMAALLYLGAGIGMLAIQFAGNLACKEKKEARLTKKDAPYVVGMVVLDIAAPICLLIGLSSTSAAGVSLLNNFEIVVTVLIASVLFKESIGKMMWVAILFITAASAVLSVEDWSQMHFSAGSLLVVLACVCWGLENNCTRMISLKNPLQIVVIKGFGSGIGALFVGFIIGERTGAILFIGLTLLLGFFAYGLSIYFYIHAQRDLGAARTSAYYAVAPFIGVGLSLVLFRDPLPSSFWIAVVLMLAGTFLTVIEEHSHRHTHEPTGHEHRHTHDDKHHNHTHGEGNQDHVHYHTHEALTHDHKHKPDMHHIHEHEEE